METFEVQLLGCGAALPAFNRFPSSQVLNCQESLFLIDCGEGTQFQLAKYKIRRSRIQHIFISHLHGDHVFGLPGLITSYNLLGRKDPLYIFGPEGIEPMILQILSFSSYKLQFELIIQTITDFNGAIIFQNEDIKVKSLPLLHKIPTCGFLFEEKKKKKKKLNVERIRQYEIPLEQWKLIEDGKDIFFDDGRHIDNEELVLASFVPRKYAYCSDTQYNELLIPLLTGVNALYHETTYLHELKDKARDNGHTTALQAATLAKKANVKMLITGHYSSRYEDLDAIEKECTSVFDPVILGKEGLVVKIE